MPEAKGSDALKLGVGEVQALVLGRGAKDEAIAFTPSGEEAFLIIGRHGVPEGFELKVIEVFCELALERFDFVGEGLLEVQERPRSLSRTGRAEGSDPDVRGV